MRSDKELLELAAKAYGLEGYTYVESTPFEHCHMQKRNLCEGGFELQTQTFDSLNQPADALRLMIKLELAVNCCDGKVVVSSDRICTEKYDNWSSPETATCRAITRAAAEIGASL